MANANFQTQLKIDKRIVERMKNTDRSKSRCHETLSIKTHYSSRLFLEKRIWISLAEITSGLICFIGICLCHVSLSGHNVI